MRVARRIYTIIAWVFLVCIVIQIFIAGLATFSDSTNWEAHRTFVKFFALTPLIMFLLTFVGGIKGRGRWISLGLFLLIVLQFQTVQLFSSIGAIAALHPVIAMLLFWGAVTTVKKSNNGGTTNE
ncbi:DUF6220 domain-containing protein [Cohnella sp. WQ 127256]|uniref:DUF6220 domain-containing protein n=1 Tax=Cohnella sp. WQ 127256 TaxID=2938790 RepID=UPI00211743BF|nr:DUF6220 domain-containing protein [Cohnella sp. WQ 127256]